VALVRRFIDARGSDEHPAGVDRIQGVRVVELNIRVELEECLACSGSRDNVHAERRGARYETVGGVPGRSIPEPERLKTGVADGRSRVSGLIGIDADVSAVGLQEVVEREAAGLHRRARVLGAAK